MPGYQAVQAGHAAIQFQHQFPEISLHWFSHSNILVYLAVADEGELLALSQKCISKGLSIAQFLEPDLNHQLTAIAIEPGTLTRKICHHLPLALSQRADSLLSKKTKQYE